MVIPGQEVNLVDDRRQLVDIAYPYSGLSETFSYTDQVPQTSRDERNMRSFDIVTGRRRGAQRPGMGLYADKQAILGYYKIDAMGQVQRRSNPLTWTQQSPVRESEIEFDLTDGAYVVDSHVDSFGTTWLLNNKGEVVAVNEDGQQIESVGVPYNADHPLKSIAVDDYGNIFVATGHIQGSTANYAGQVSMMELRNDGTYKLAWTVKPDFHPLDIAIYGLDLYVFGVEHTSSIGTTYLKFARYVEYRADETPEIEEPSNWSRLYSALNGYHTGGWSSGNTAWVGRIDVRKDGQVYATCSNVDSSTNLRSGHIIKLNPLGAVPGTEIWEYGYNSANEWSTSNRDRQGYGIDVKISPKKRNGKYSLWLIGGQVTSGSAVAVAQPHIRLVDDDDTSLDWATSSDITFQTGPTAATKGWHGVPAPGADNINMAVDDAGRLYVPYGRTTTIDPQSIYAGDGTTGETNNVLVVDSNASSVIHQYTALQLGRATWVELCVAVPFATPNYNNSVPAPTTVDTMIVGGQYALSAWAGAEQNAAVQVRLVNPSIPQFQPKRELRTIVLCGGNWYKYDATTVTQIAGATYDRTSRYQHTTTYDGAIYVADGLTIWKYDALDDTVERLTCKSNGEVPRRMSLIEHWRGRLVCAGDKEKPGVWRMSRVGDFEDWDEFPVTADSAAAVSSQTGRAGTCPDAINTIVPYSDDLLWFGCDNSIWQLSGDPGSQHVFDNISDEIGMAYGKPWCRDDRGRLWFFGSKGGLYTLQSGGGLEDVGNESVRQRLRSINLSQYYVRLAYNYNEDGIHVFLCPYENPQITVDHFFYCKRTASWHIDRFGNTEYALQPTAVQVVDGDAPDDRAIHLGCEDGRIRRWGKDSDGRIPYSDQKHDGIAAQTPNVPIDSYVLMGPLAPVRDVSEAAFGEFTVVLSSRFDGCNYEFFVSDDPEHLGNPTTRGSLSAGRNGTKLVRVVGDSVFLRLRNVSSESHWAYEKGSIQTVYAGTVRRN